MRGKVRWSAWRRALRPWDPAVVGPRPAELPTESLRRVLTVGYAVLRLCTAVTTVGLAALWHDWYAGHPVGQLGVALAVAWSLTFAVVAVRRGIGPRLAAGNVAVAILLVGGVRWWLPPELVGDPAAWPQLAATHAVGVAAWVLPRRRFLAVTAMTAVAAALGTVVAGSPSAVPPLMTCAAALLVWYLLPRLRGLAVGVEQRLLRAAQSRVARAAVRAGLRERREHELEIHNAVLNTLTGIAWGGGGDATLTRRRCAEGETALRGLLAAEESPGGAVAATAASPLPAAETVRALVAAEFPVSASPLPRRPRPMPAPQEEWAGSPRAEYSARLRRVTSGFAVVWLGLAAAPGVRLIPGARSVPLAVCLVVGPVAIAGLARWQFRSGPLRGCQASVLVAVCALIGLVGPWSVGAGAAGVVSWPLNVLPPLLMVVTVSCPPCRWVGAAIIITAAMTVGTLAANGNDPLAASHLVLTIHQLWMLPLCLVLVGPVLWRTADARSWAVYFERDLGRDTGVEDHVRERRRGLLRAVEREIVPLLARVAAGRADPCAQDVRADCGLRAVGMRRLLFDDDAVHSVVGDVIGSAERRGTVVFSQLHGGLDQIPAVVRGELVELLHHALWAMPDRRVLLTVTADVDAVSVFLSCPWPAGQGPPAAASRDVEMVVDIDDGHLCLELCWPATSRTTSPLAVSAG